MIWFASTSFEIELLTIAAIREKKKKEPRKEKKNVQSTNTNNARRHFEKESEQVQTPARHSGITQETIHQQVQSKIERLVILVQEPNT